MAVIDIGRNWCTDLVLVDGPWHYGPACAFQWDSRTHADAMNPTVYLFTNNDLVSLRNSGVPELTMPRFRPSFEPEPQWLDDATWHDYDGEFADARSSNEVQDGLHIRTFEL